MWTFLLTLFFLGERGKSTNNEHFRLRKHLTMIQYDKIGCRFFFRNSLGNMFVLRRITIRNNNMNRIENDVTTKPGITSEVLHFSVKNDSIQLKLN